MTEHPPEPTARAASAAPGRARGPVFLERATYRQRRLVDAARLLPVLGVFLWAMPLLWGAGGTTTSAAILYIFAAWLGLVIGAAVLAFGLGRTGATPGQVQEPVNEPQQGPEAGV